MYMRHEIRFVLTIPLLLERFKRCFQYLSSLSAQCVCWSPVGRKAPMHWQSSDPTPRSLLEICNSPFKNYPFISTNELRRTVPLVDAHSTHTSYSTGKTNSVAYVKKKSPSHSLTEPVTFPVTSTCDHQSRPSVKFSCLGGEREKQREHSLFHVGKRDRHKKVHPFVADVGAISSDTSCVLGFDQLRTLN